MQRLRLLAGMPQVLEEAEHDVRLAAAGAIAAGARLGQRQRVVAQQFHQHPPALPAVAGVEEFVTYAGGYK